jgi:hypothetical protein
MQKMLPRMQPDTKAASANDPACVKTHRLL